jgi:hypothetical protein
MNVQLIASLTIAGGLLLLTIVLLLIRCTVTATVDGFSWKRTVSLEHLIWVKETSYTGYPDGSRNHSSTVEAHQTYQVIGYQTTTTMLNGRPVTSTQPVYGFVPHPRKKFLYEIQRWVKSRELLAEGNDRATVYWPEYTLDAHTQERVYKTKETYLVCFKTPKGKIYKVTLPEKDWAELDEKATYKLRVSLFQKVFFVEKVE